VNGSKESSEWLRRHNVKLHHYPLDPHDPTLLERCVFHENFYFSLASTTFIASDRLTGELLRRLNPSSSPSFHNYGNNPPSAVLDLGCGQGHWVLEAAITWKDHGTKVIGFDMLEVAKSIWPWAINQGVAENTRFVRGNLCVKISLLSHFPTLLIAILCPVSKDHFRSPRNPLTWSECRI
jgi:SAM-dependent methyltransferase